MTALADIPTVRRSDFVLFIGAAIFIYTQLFHLPWAPIYFDGDVMNTVSNATRMLDGEVMYRDFFHLTPPGAELIYAGLFSLFGIKVSVVNLTVFVLSLSLVLLIWFLSRKTLAGTAVYLPPLIFLVIGYRQFGVDGSYRLFSIVFALAAVAVLLETRSIRNLVAAAILCGLASFFVHTRGAVVIAGISLFLAWESYSDGFDFKQMLPQIAALGFAFLTTVVITQAYFAGHAGWENYFFALIEFPRTHYAHDPPNQFSAYLSDLPPIWGEAVFSYVRSTAAIWFYYLLIPAVYILLVVYSIKQRHAKDRIPPAIVLLGCIGIFLAVGTSAPTATRLYHVAIPGIVILVWLCTRLQNLQRLAPVAAAVLVLLGAAYAVQRQIIEKHFLDMPAGRAAFLYRPLFERYEWVRDNTKPGDIVYEPHHPNFYFPMHLKNPTPLYMARDSEYTPRFQVEAVVQALEKRPPRLIIWPAVWSKPAEERAPGDNLAPLWHFVGERYERRHVFPAFDLPIQTIRTDSEVWQLKP